MGRRCKGLASQPVVIYDFVGGIIDGETARGVFDITHSLARGFLPDPPDMNRVVALVRWC